jgi:hypothetical protein
MTMHPTLWDFTRSPFAYLMKMMGTKVTTMGIKGIFNVVSSSPCDSSSKANLIPDEWKINELFHI